MTSTQRFLAAVLVVALVVAALWVAWSTEIRPLIEERNRIAREELEDQRLSRQPKYPWPAAPMPCNPNNPYNRFGCPKD